MIKHFHVQLPHIPPQADIIILRGRVSVLLTLILEHVSLHLPNIFLEHVELDGGEQAIFREVNPPRAQEVSQIDSGFLGPAPACPL